MRSGRARKVGRRYANDLLLKVWLYGYLARIRATRELERACREHLSLLWLTGRQAPDHNTLWRFWQENGGALRKVFRAAVKVAAGQGLIGMICHAVEGTKIRAVASGRTMEHQEDLEKVLARVEEELARMEAEIEAAEQAPGGDYRLPAGLREAENLRAAIRESLGKMRRAERAHLHPQEPEARLMPCEGRNDPAYNAQAVVDAQAGIIVAEEAVTAEADNAQLVPMLEEVEANLGGVAQGNGGGWRVRFGGAVGGGGGARLRSAGGGGSGDGRTEARRLRPHGICVRGESAMK